VDWIDQLERLCRLNNSKNVKLKNPDQLFQSTILVHGIEDVVKIDFPYSCYHKMLLDLRKITLLTHLIHRNVKKTSQLYIEIQTHIIVTMLW
jgi:hypothetical protein